MSKTTITVDNNKPIEAPVPPKAEAPIPNTPPKEAKAPEIDYKAKYEALVRQNEINNQLQDIAPEHRDVFKLVMENVADPAKIKAELLAKNSVYKKSEVPAPTTAKPQAFTQPDVNAGGIGTQNTDIDPLDTFVPKEVRQASK